MTDTNPQTSNAGAAGSGDSGPGTGSPAPKDHVQRTPADTVVVAKDDARGAADVKRALEPPEGVARTSTNPVADISGQSNVAGENHVRLATADGKTVKANRKLFGNPLGATGFVVAEQDIVEEFTYPNTTTVAQRVKYPAGHRVPLWEAEQLQAAADRAAAQAKQPNPT